MKARRLIYCIGLTALLTACASIPLQPLAQNIRVTHEAPAAQCKFVTQVASNQGNFYTGPWTTVASLEKTALNDIRNQANAKGANTIYLTRDEKMPASKSSGGPGVAIQLNGRAYYCPQR